MNNFSKKDRRANASNRQGHLNHIRAWIKVNESKSAHRKFSCLTINLSEVDIPQREEVKYLQQPFQTNLKTMKIYWLTGRESYLFIIIIIILIIIIISSL